MTVRVLSEPGPQSAASAPAQTSVSDGAGTILAANPKRKGFMVQNTGTTIIYIAFSSTDPTTSAYHVALPACSSANDGTSQPYTDDACYTGVVKAIGSAAGGTCVVTEFTVGTGADFNRSGDYELEG